jgi:hypothetical protein
LDVQRRPALSDTAMYDTWSKYVGVWGQWPCWHENTSSMITIYCFMSTMVKSKRPDKYNDYLCTSLKNLCTYHGLRMLMWHFLAQWNFLQNAYYFKRLILQCVGGIKLETSFYLPFIFFTSIYISHRDSNIYGLMNTIFLTPGWHIYYILILIENEGSTLILTLIREKEKRKITHHCHYNLLVKNTLT